MGASGLVGGLGGGKSGVGTGKVGSLLREGALCSVQLFTRMPRVEHPLWAEATIQVMLPLSFFVMIKYTKHKICHFNHV